jgi:MoxR-like ATPase
VKRVAPDVLRHRVVVTYEAEADGLTSEQVVDAVLRAVETP